MKFLFFVLLVTWVATSTTMADNGQKETPPVDVPSLSGEYTFNPSCTDEMATVKVTFRKAKGDEHGMWRADGFMNNGFHGTSIAFTGAYVETGDEGGVVVSAQFFEFRILGKVLEWLPGYQRTLYKMENGKLLDHAN